MRFLVTAALCLPLLAGCSALGEMLDGAYTYTDPQTGEQVTTTVGDAVADQVDSTGSVIGGVVGKAVGVATANPVVGVSAGALLTALIGSGATAIRRRKKKPGDEEA